MRLYKGEDNILTMQKTVIGIISYLPDNVEKKNKRLCLLFNLLSKCYNLFQLPVIIIAQNWKSELVRVPWATIYRYDDKLGIVNARKELRRVFLESNYDNLIMLDDDSIIKGNNEDGKKYLEQIEYNPGLFYEFQGTLLKLFAISREVFEKQDFIEVNPELEEGFEDRVFVNALRKRFPDKRYIFNKYSLSEESISTDDSLSTWHTNQDNKKMLEKTEELIKNLN